MSEAQRIRLAHLFDPVLAVHTSLVEPLPHQITPVYEAMLPRQPLRFLPADDPGAGKTIMAGLLINELIARGDLKRCLIVCPGSLVEQWQDELSRKFQLPFEIATNDKMEAASGVSLLDITRTLNDEGITTPNDKRWLKTSIHRLLTNEAYTGTVVWGTNAKDGAPPVRVENAFPAIGTRNEFEQVGALLRAKAPSQVHPRRAASPYLLSGLAKCETCRKSLTAQEAKGGKYTCYVCQSLLKRGRGACDTPRLNSTRFERLIIEQIREHILTESNIRELVAPCR